MGGRGKRGNNHRGRGGADKHVSGFEEVKARNADLMRREERGEDIYAVKRKDKDAEDAPPAEPVKTKKSGKGDGYPSTKDAAPAAASTPAVEQEEEFDDLDNNPYLSAPKGPQLTRKQREEHAKEAARRRYEEMHKRGETDEAKADLARLAEVKARRETAAAKKKEEEDKARAEEVLSRSTARDKALKDCGLDGARVRGARAGKDKKQESSEDEEEEETKEPEIEIMAGVNDFYALAATTETKKTGNLNNSEVTNQGNIHSCRAIEEDFM